MELFGITRRKRDVAPAWHVQNAGARCVLQQGSGARVDPVDVIDIASRHRHHAGGEVRHPNKLDRVDMGVVRFPILGHAHQAQNVCFGRYISLIAAGPDAVFQND